MPTIKIANNLHSYEEADVITFPEGLVGLPQVRRAVVVSMSEFEPFCWLAPLDSDELRFVVVDPHKIFDGYVPFARETPDEMVYAIVTVSSDWARTTFNLKAPIVVDRQDRSAYQRVLTDGQYHFAETLPQN